MNYTIISDKLPKVLQATYERFTEVSYAISEFHFSENSKKIALLHYHNTPELGICIEGSGECIIGKRSYRYKAGDIQIIRAFEPHYSNSDEGGGTWKYITFTPSKLMRRAGLSDPEAVLSIINEGLSFSGVFSPSEFPELTGSINEILRRSEQKDESTELSAALAVADFFIASKRASRSITDINLKDEYFMPSDDYRSILPALSLIGGNLDDNEKLSEQRLAEACGMSISTMRRRFTRAAGMSPKTYITNTRMVYAEYLLSKTNLPVLDISLRCGYGEISGFNRTFLSFFKTTPGKYRKGGK